MNNETNLNVTETATITTDMNCNIDETATESYIVSPVTTYEEKMDFLSQIRKECGLDKVDVDIHDDSSHAGKYITEYTFGTI